MLLAGESEKILTVTTALAQRKKNPTRELSVWGEAIRDADQATSTGLLAAEILHVGIGAEAGVIGEIPAWVIWVVVYHDVVAVP